jgi:hypothetical protein
MSEKMSLPLDTIGTIAAIGASAGTTISILFEVVRKVANAKSSIQRLEDSVVLLTATLNDHIEVSRGNHVETCERLAGLEANVCAKTR